MNATDKWFASSWTWINENAGALGLILALIPLLWGAITFISIKRSEDRQRRFENYHKLIQQLVEREDAEKPKMLDRQLAVVFELGKYPEYAHPTLQILKGLKQQWSESSYGPREKNQRLIEQMNSTIESLEKRSSWFRILLTLFF